MHIRPEQIDDRASIYDLLCQAFPTPEEALLVERLRESGSATVALVAIAEDDNGEHDVVGHVVFSPVELEPQTPWPGLGLAPLAVRPRVQRQGIGSQLVQAGLDACRATGAGFVVVLGDPVRARALVRRAESLQGQPGEVALLNAETLALLGDPGAARQRLAAARAAGIADTLITSNFSFRRLGLLSSTTTAAGAEPPAPRTVAGHPPGG